MFKVLIQRLPHRHAASESDRGTTILMKVIRWSSTQTGNKLYINDYHHATDCHNTGTDIY